jgi:hypothetical protein
MYVHVYIEADKLPLVEVSELFVTFVPFTLFTKSISLPVLTWFLCSTT